MKVEEIFVSVLERKGNDSSSQFRVPTLLESPFTYS